MQDIKQRELKIQEKRKHTAWRDFVMERCSWRALNFYKNQGLISRFPKTDRILNIKSNRDFESIRNNEQEILYNQDFFSSFSKLLKEVPQRNMIYHTETENCEFADSIHSGKNVYLSSAVYADCTNILYSFEVRYNCEDVISSVFVFNSKNIFRSVSVVDSYNIFLSRGILNSNNIWFSSNLIGCSDCLSCNNLQNQSYCIENIGYSKEDFLIKKDEYLKAKDVYNEKYYSVLDQIIDNQNSLNSHGEGLSNSDNIDQGFFVSNLKNGRNVIFGGSKKGPSANHYDCLSSGFQGDFFCSQDCGNGSENIYFSTYISACSNCFYSIDLESCSYCLGCIGLKNKSFCILNKQYTKEERFEKANEIFAQMDKDGTLGQFFPGSMNPFYFNDTVAYLIDDTFTKEEVIKQGYLRRDEEIKVDVPANAEVITTNELVHYQGYDSQGIRQIDPEILKKVIKDEKGNYYRIVPMELEFLQKHGLPLPEIHWLERIKLGFKFK